MAQAKVIKEFVDVNNITVDCTPSITEKALGSYLCHECVIENYSKLKEKIYYTMTEDEELPERTLKLFKTKKINSFQFHCELRNSYIEKNGGGPNVDKMEFYIMYEKDKDICPADLTETNYGFSIEVPNEIITNSANKYLAESDKLIIQFRYRHYLHRREPICRSGIPKNEDEEILSNDLLALYKSGKFTDFAIIDDEGTKHLVHKCLCRSRSATIDKIDDENVVALTVQGKSRHVDIAIQYMYGGILPQLSLDDLLKLLVVAHELDIRFLLHSIQQTLLEILNKSNAAKIHRATLKHSNMHQITALAKELLPEETGKKKRSRR